VLLRRDNGTNIGLFAILLSQCSINFEQGQGELFHLAITIMPLLTIQRNDVAHIAHILLFCVIVIALMGIRVALNRWVRQFADGN
jgi:hypothetical protein